MINWIKNLFTSSPAPGAEAPYKLETPVVEEVVATLVALTPQAAWPFASLQAANDDAKPKTADVKKAAPKTASKNRGRKPKKA